MTSQDDHDLKEWVGDWQAAPYDQDAAEQIRHYVNQRTGFFWSLAVADFVIGGIALPVLLYLGIYSQSQAEQFGMAGLASLTLATVMFGWWNRRGVLRSSATTIAEYVAISAERLRRMRITLRIGWWVMAAEVGLLSMWISGRLYSKPTPPTAGAELFAWTWLGGFTLLAIVYLLWFSRWINRDAARFDALRRELESD